MRRWFVWILIALVLILPQPARGDANAFAHLDRPLDPYYVHRDFPKLTTPQWVGDPRVDAVVVLAIDDMRDVEKYEGYLRPLLNRLKRIDGRAPVSIMTNSVDPSHPHLQTWLREGLSIEVHTIDHPCPCLSDGSLSKAKSTYDRCVDLMASIDGNDPVAFRMPCCDSLNTPSPRFWTEVFEGTTPGGNHLRIDSSVFNLFTPNDRELPKPLVQNEDGSERFRRYIPFPSFVNTIENYPYPYVIGRSCWQFPCMVPSDWEAQNIQKPNNPRTLADLKLALDATVMKRGVFNLVFHPHGWIRNEQMVEFVDYAATKYGSRVRFLNFREAAQLIESNLLSGRRLRHASGGDGGIRLLDLNFDGYLDVVIGSESTRLTRIWDPRQRKWREGEFPLSLVTRNGGDAGVRFGVLPQNVPFVLAMNDSVQAGWSFDGAWRAESSLPRGLETDGQPVLAAVGGVDQGMRIRDVDHDGNPELVVANPTTNVVFQWSSNARTWQRLPFAMPEGTSIVDEQGRDAGLRLYDVDGDGSEDVIFSNEDRSVAYLFEDTNRGWSRRLIDSRRGQAHDLPIIVNHGKNNGAWLHSGHLWLQNETTDQMSDGVDRIAMADILQAATESGESKGSDDNPFAPAKSPTESLATMTVPDGMTIELVVAEPLVTDPVAFDWSPDGRLWVAEMRDYPNGLDGKPGGRVRLVRDTDDDGKYDDATTFVDELPYPTGVKSWREGVLILAAPNLIYAEDTDGDGQADKQETVLTGFRPGNPQHLANGLRWGLDNWLHIANGDSGGDVRSVRTGQQIAIRSRDMRLRVDSGELDAVSGQTQYGRNRDDWGNWFGGNNSQPMWHYVLEDFELRRNPEFVPPDARHQISERPGAAPVFPTSQTVERFNDFEKANRFTSACSPMIYRDTLLGDAFAGNAFVCEPVHNLVHREIVEPDGVTFRSFRSESERNSEFLTSEDIWFRPSMVRTGPDGALWITDMYRLVIEHPEWIPQAWQDRLNLQDGNDRGRIYRIYPKGTSLRSWVDIGSLSAAELVDRLNSPNGTQRDTVHQMLLWRNANEQIERIAALATAATSPQARIQALAVLDGLNAVTPKLLARTLQDPHPRVVRHALLLSQPHLNQHASLRQAVLKQEGHRSPSVRLQLAICLGFATGSDASHALARMAQTEHDNHFFIAAIQSSLTKGNVESMAREYIRLTSKDNDASETTRKLLDSAGRLAPVAAIKTLIQAVEQDNPAYKRKASLVIAILQGAAQRDDISIRDVLTGTVDQAVKQLSDESRALVQNENATNDELQVAIEFLSHRFTGGDKNAELVSQLLTPKASPGIRAAAIGAIAQLRGKKTVSLLLSDWTSHSPSMRDQILDELLRRPTWTKQLLEAIESGNVSAFQLDARRRNTLLAHRDDSVRRTAMRLFQTSSQSNRHEIVEQFRGVAMMKGTAAAGKAVFAKRCATCHRLEEVGREVGPSLTTLTNRSPMSLLTALLDPNQAVEDRYVEYRALLEDGRQVSGMLSRETSSSIVLVGPEGKQNDILRSQIDELRSSGKSLMPEGLERDMTRQELADVIAYVASSRPPAKSFPGNHPQLAPVRDDGSIRLLAIHARIYGPTLVFEGEHRNLGYWSSVDDHAIWTAEVPRAQTYKVDVEFACDDSVSGDSYVIEAAGQTVGGRATGSGGWDNYRSRSAGSLKLPAGKVDFVVRSAGPIRSYLMDLRAIRLYPEN